MNVNMGNRNLYSFFFFLYAVSLPDSSKSTQMYLCSTVCIFRWLLMKGYQYLKQTKGPPKYHSSTLWDLRLYQVDGNKSVIS